KTSIFSHPVYLFLREFSLQDFRGGSIHLQQNLLIISVNSSTKSLLSPGHICTIEYYCSPDSDNPWRTIRTLQPLC
ncbi:hypothetical protein C9009_24730, partial [Escherichia coli]